MSVGTKCHVGGRPISRRGEERGGRAGSPGAVPSEWVSSAGVSWLINLSLYLCIVAGKRSTRVVSSRQRQTGSPLLSLKYSNEFKQTWYTVLSAKGAPP